MFGVQQYSEALTIQLEASTLQHKASPARRPRKQPAAEALPSPLAQERPTWPRLHGVHSERCAGGPQAVHRWFLQHHIDCQTTQNSISVIECIIFSLPRARGSVPTPVKFAQKRC